MCATTTIQLKALIAQGLSIEEAADMLQLSVEDCKASIAARAKAGLVNIAGSADEYRSVNKLKMLKILEEIADDPEANPGARVAAAKAFMDGEVVAEEKEMDKLTAMYMKMKEVVEKNGKSSNTTPAKTTVILGGTQTLTTV